MSYRNYTLDRNLDISLTHGASGYDNVAVIRGEGLEW